MKFARYLEETQVPEWKKAYIDYRGLKKRITQCRKEKDRGNAKRPASPQLDSHLVTTRSHTGNELQPDETFDDEVSINSEHMKYHHASISPNPGPLSAGVHFPIVRPSGTRKGETSRSVDPPPGTSRQRASENTDDSNRSNASVSPGPVPGRLEGIQRPATLNMGMLPRLRRQSTFRLPSSLRRGATGRWELSGDPRAPWDPRKPLSLAGLIPLLTHIQRAFFEKLDSELDKVEAFYVEREKEMITRTQALKAQLHELQMHRQEYYEAQQNHSWLNFSLMRPNAVAKLKDNFQGTDGSTRKQRPRQDGKRVQNVASSSSTDLNKVADIVHDSSGSSDPDSPTPYNTGGAGSAENEDERNRGKKIRSSLQKHAPISTSLGLTKHDPEEYDHAKRKLKKAVLECYRGLEILNNYRTLNIIGFRKALKKFEKVTKVPSQQAYTVERIEPNTFTSTHIVEEMMRDLEERFAARFTRGDKKKALSRLRGGVQHKSHHFSTFCSGLMLGLAIPALIDGLVESFRSDTRKAIPGWDGLLYVYSILFVPVFFALLVGLNLQVWAASRINYVFIFELELRTKIDHREYYEIPAFLMSTLCYAFWLSFKRIGEDKVTPTIWPLLWLALVAAVMLNPFPIFFKRSRYWLLGNVSKLLVSGTHRVEFTDFWMGDQMCSLIFTLSNLYFIPCAYIGGLDANWQRCTSRTPHWGVPFVLATLPLLARAVQSIKRWYDSKLPTHLINGGKYATGIFYYLCYFIWRHQGGGRGSSFVAWCVFATSYSIYASAWDLLMDWSLLRPHAQHTLLRTDILYTSAIPLYYFAIISNVLIRFTWVFYIPEGGPTYILRTFITAMLEALRRWQWNFFRLENEHLGNVDQYRVTREVPLPYVIYDGGDDTDDDDERSRNSGSARSVSSSLRWRRRRSDSGQQDNYSDQLSSD